MSYTINTERLKLIPFSLEDSTLFQDLNNLPFIRKYMWDDEKIDYKTSKEIIHQNDKHFKEDGYGIWKIHLKENSEIIGYVGLWYFFDEPQPQLIYAILEEYTGSGYATEASSSIINYAFEKLEFSYLIAATDEPHLSSQKVATRLGMSLLEKRIVNNKSTLFYKIENRLKK